MDVFANRNVLKSSSQSSPSLTKRGHSNFLCIAGKPWLSLIDFESLISNKEASSNKLSDKLLKTLFYLGTSLFFDGHKFYVFV